MNGDKKEKSGNPMMIVIIVAALVIIALLAVIIVLLNKKDKPEENVKRNTVVNSVNAEEVANELIHETYVAPGYYSTQMSTTWHFATGDAVSEDAYVKNDAGNTNDIYFDVFLESDESTPILQSPIIPRGSEIKGITLDKPLKAGTHDCVMVYHLVDDEQNTVSTLRIAFTIIVEN